MMIDRPFKMMNGGRVSPAEGIDNEKALPEM